MPVTWSMHGETALGFALAEFQLLQLLTEGPSPELLDPDLVDFSKQLADKAAG